MIPHLRRIRGCSRATTSSVVATYRPSICDPTLHAVGDGHQVTAAAKVAARESSIFWEGAAMGKGESTGSGYLNGGTIGKELVVVVGLPGLGRRGRWRPPVRDQAL
jgi:hypothetical protein